jgi:pimeloyl-ACP methyl ester carboxylesterase
MHDLILLPGLASDATVFRDQIPALRAAGHAVVVADVHTRCPTLPAMAAALLAEQAGPLVLCGTSMGGMIALEAVRQAPQRVRALALLGTSARADTPELVALREAAIVEFEGGRVDAVLRANVPFAFHPRVRADSELVRTYIGFVRRAGAAQLVRQNRAVIGRADLRPTLGAIRCPTLVACGDSDLLTPPEHGREIAAAIPGARFELIAECGHLLTLEQPAAVNALLLEWLAGLR